MDSGTPYLLSTLKGTSQPEHVVTDGIHSAPSRGSSESEYVSLPSYPKKSSPSELSVQESAGWLADDGCQRFGSQDEPKSLQHIDSKENRHQPPSKSHNPAHSSPLIPRTVLQPHNGTTAAQTLGQRVPVLFLDDYNGRSSHSSSKGDDNPETESAEVDPGCSHAPCSRIQLRVHALREENKQLVVKNIRLAGDLCEAQAETKRFRRVFEMQGKDFEQLKAHVQQIQKSIDGLSMGNDLDKTGSLEETILKIGKISLKPVYQLGRGAYGVVLCAIGLSNQWPLGQEVAIKIMDRVNLSSFYREMAFLLALGDHEITPQLLASAESDKLVVLIMSKCHASLYDRLTVSPSSALPEDSCRAIIKDLLHLISKMHKKGYIHFDIKPHNILFTSNGRMQLCDGGLSSHVDHIPTTRTLMRGTEGYMSPEVMSGEAQLHPFAVDMYCVGTTLVRMRNISLPVGPIDEKRMHDLIEEAFPITEYKEANKFLAALLLEDAGSRLSAKQALAHPWIKGYNEKSDHLEWLINLNPRRITVDLAIDIGPFTDVQVY